MGTTLKEETGKTLSELIEEYKSVMADFEVYHSSLESTIKELGKDKKSETARRFQKAGEIAVMVIRTAEPGSEKYIHWISHYNELCENLMAAE